MDMVAQLAQSPALHAMAEGLAESLEPRQARRGGERGGEAGEAPPAPPDFGALMQQMLPMVGQVRNHC